MVVVRVGDLPANMQPEMPDPVDAGSSIGWGWLAVFWVVALGIVAGLSMFMFGYRLQGGFVAGLSLVGLVVALIVFLREKKLEVPVVASELSQTVINRPHRTGVALSSAEFSRMLAVVEHRCGPHGSRGRVDDQVGGVPADRRHGTRIVRAEAIHQVGPRVCKRAGFADERVRPPSLRRHVGRVSRHSLCESRIGRHLGAG